MKSFRNNGVETASQRYFGKSVHDLNLAARRHLNMDRLVGHPRPEHRRRRIDRVAEVADPNQRHTPLLGQPKDALDLASEGRVEFGIGAGWMKSDYDESGMSYDRPGLIPSSSMTALPW